MSHKQGFCEMEKRSLFSIQGLVFGGIGQQFCSQRFPDSEDS
jgi:hypothetical protein